MAQRKLDCFFHPQVPGLRKEYKMMEILVKMMMKRETANKDQGAVPSKKEHVFQFEHALIKWKSRKTWKIFSTTVKDRK